RRWVRRRGRAGAILPRAQPGSPWWSPLRGPSASGRPCAPGRSPASVRPPAYVGPLRGVPLPAGAEAGAAAGAGAGARRGRGVDVGGVGGGARADLGAGAVPGVGGRAETGARQGAGGASGRARVPELRGERPVPSWASAATSLPRRGPVPAGAEASSYAPAPAGASAHAPAGAGPRPGTGLKAAGPTGSAGRRPVSGPEILPTVPPPRPRWWRSVGPALRDRLPLWLQLRCSLEPKSLAALAVVLVGAAVLAGAHFWSARPQTVSAPERVRGAAAEALVPAMDSGVSGSPGSGPGAAGGPRPWVRAARSSSM
ncbi:hypothetical protein GA0115249_105428, partial [Streptomyces sp. PpalLS-921]